MFNIIVHTVCELTPGKGGASLRLSGSRNLAGQVLNFVFWQVCPEQQQEAEATSQKQRQRQQARRTRSTPPNLAAHIPVRRGSQ